MDVKLIGSQAGSVSKLLTIQYTPARALLRYFAAQSVEHLMLCPSIVFVIDKTN